MFKAALIIQVQNTNLKKSSCFTEYGVLLRFNELFIIANLRLPFLLQVLLSTKELVLNKGEAWQILGQYDL